MGERYTNGHATHDINVQVSHDGSWGIFVVALLLALGLCTRSGNEYMCREKMAPTFIDCSKVAAPTHAKGGNQ